MPIYTRFSTSRRAALLALAALTTAPASAQSALPSGITDPGEIDRVVAQFTGAAIGATGGARQPADRRLRLAPCSQPLFASWHGQAQTTVSVECPDPGGWRIFVATLSPQTPASQEQAERAVKRGDPITVVVRGRGFSVQQAGEALDNGAIGDWIGVRTSRRGEPVRARIERPGLAIIPAN